MTHLDAAIYWFKVLRKTAASNKAYQIYKDYMWYCLILHTIEVQS